MAPSDRNKDHGSTAPAEYEAHVGQLEDKLEAAASQSDAAFREHTAEAKAKLEAAEDKLEAAARRAENR